MVKHVSHRIPLEPELVGQVDEHVLDLFDGNGTLAIGGPGRVGVHVYGLPDVVDITFLASSVVLLLVVGPALGLVHVHVHNVGWLHVLVVVGVAHLGGRVVVVAAMVHTGVIATAVNAVVHTVIIDGLAILVVVHSILVVFPMIRHSDDNSIYVRERVCGGCALWEHLQKYTSANIYTSKYICLCVVVCIGKEGTGPAHKRSVQPSIIDTRSDQSSPNQHFGITTFSQKISQKMFVLKS